MARIVALTCALVLGCGVATAGADVLPVAGPWHATTSAGLPISFEVRGSQLVNARFRFKWGFCGSFESATGGSVPIEPNGHWKYVDSRGPFAEGTFVAPDRAEGTVTAPSRMLPGCPETHAAFVAEPGAVPFEQAEAVVLANVVTHRLVSAPAGMNLRRDGSLQFYELDWQNFGDSVARGTGRAFLRKGCRRCRDKVVRRPRVVVYLNELTQQGDYRVYLHANYRFVGPIPPGFSRHGSRILEHGSRTRCPVLARLYRTRSSLRAAGRPSLAGKSACGFVLEDLRGVRLRWLPYDVCSESLV
jgi:hypothetical protein